MKHSYSCSIVMPTCGDVKDVTTSTFILNIIKSNIDASTCVVNRHPLSVRNKVAIQKIQSFSDLESNWDTYEADVVSKEVVRESVGVVEKINGYNRDIYFAAPGPNGEISIELRNGDKNLELIVYPHVIKHVSFENKSLFTQGTLQHQGIPSLIDWLYAKPAVEK